MSETLLNHPHTIIPSEEDSIAAKDSSRQFAGVKTNGQKTLSLRVESEGGEVTVPIPISLFRLMSDVLTHMASGNSVTIMPLHAVLTTYQAANFLNVSRPFLVELIEAGKLPYHKVGPHRRIVFADLLEFKRKNDEARLLVLAELTREAQELGMGY